MRQNLICIPINTPVMACTGRFLNASGIPTVSTADASATHLLLPVPAFRDGGYLSDGSDPEELLSQFPDSLPVIGGKLTHPLLRNRIRLDLLQDEAYLAPNARITAECAISLAARQLPVTWTGTPALVLGWGRIGQCLCRLLQANGAAVSLTARNPAARGMAAALGCQSLSFPELPDVLGNYRVIFNTVPTVVLPEEWSRHCSKDCLKIDLASNPGIAGEDTIAARGLPGKMAPESSGRLIAQWISQKLTVKEEFL